jgi:hypothetical protein
VRLHKCTHRHRTLGQHLCDAESISADLLEPAVWEGTRKAVTEDLDALIAAHYGEVTTEEDKAVLASLREEYKRKVIKVALKLFLEFGFLAGASRKPMQLAKE